MDEAKAGDMEDNDVLLHPINRHEYAYRIANLMCVSTLRQDMRVGGLMAARKATKPPHVVPDNTSKMQEAVTAANRPPLSRREKLIAALHEEEKAERRRGEYDNVAFEENPAGEGIEGRAQEQAEPAEAEAEAEASTAEVAADGDNGKRQDSDNYYAALEVEGGSELDEAGADMEALLAAEPEAKKEVAEEKFTSAIATQVGMAAAEQEGKEESEGKGDGDLNKSVAGSTKPRVPFCLTRFLPNGYAGEVSVMAGAWVSSATNTECGSEGRDTSSHRFSSDSDHKQLSDGHTATVPHLKAPPPPSRAEPKEESAESRGESGGHGRKGDCDGAKGGDDSKGGSSSTGASSESKGGELQSQRYTARAGSK